MGVQAKVYNGVSWGQHRGAALGAEAGAALEAALGAEAGAGEQTRAEVGVWYALIPLPYP